MAIVVTVISLFSGCAAPNRVHIRGVQGNKLPHVTTSRGDKLETLSLALLESCTYENDEAVANAKVWNQYEGQAHLAVLFEPARDVRVRGTTIAITELMIPIIAKDFAPPYLFVRTDGRIRAFCKHDCLKTMALQEELSGLVH